VNQQPFEERAILVEANLVVDENAPPVENALAVASLNTSLLVEATPVRQMRQIALIIVALVAVASIVGVTVGLTKNQTPPPPAPSTMPVPTLVPTSQFEA
jgi:hypothetical protein